LHGFASERSSVGWLGWQAQFGIRDLDEGVRMNAQRHEFYPAGFASACRRGLIPNRLPTV
jgi:hypothetical protein